LTYASLRDQKGIVFYVQNFVISRLFRLNVNLYLFC